MQVDDTLDFAECFHDSSEPMNLGTSIYACILVCAKLPSHTNIQRAVDYGTLWINATPTADPTHSERQNIVNELIDQQREWLRFEEDGVFSEVPW